MLRFRNRASAGRLLSDRLVVLGLDRPVVLGLARGGVPVAVPVALRLHAPLDVVVVRKLGVPTRPEFAFGALGEDGVRVIDQRIVDRWGVPSEAVERIVADEQAELERRLERYRGSRRPVGVTGRTVVVVDDGLATGATAEAAMRLLRLRGADRIVLATPVAPPDTLERLRSLADDVVCVHAPRDFMAVGQWYDEFAATTDDEVIRLLTATAPDRAAAGATPKTVL